MTATRSPNSIGRRASDTDTAEAALLGLSALNRMIATLSERQRGIQAEIDRRERKEPIKERE